MANEYRFTKVAVDVMGKASSPKIRVYTQGIEVLRTVAATNVSFSPSARMQIIC